MGTFFNRERFGRPQFFSGMMLMAFLVQCLWLVAHATGKPQADPDQQARVNAGLRQWKGEGVAGTPLQLDAASASADGGSESARSPINRKEDGFDVHHSPLHYLISSAPLLLRSQEISSHPSMWWGWLARLPYLLAGLLMGASLWYVAHRLYGHAGGYVALALYCFSPGILRSSAVWFERPEMVAVWGAFGSAFTAIAVAHTLYAPREVVLWNWRRIILVGLSFALAIGSQFSLFVVIPLVLGLLLYLAPDRKQAGVVIWGAACLVALVLLLASYSFQLSTLWESIKHAQLFSFSPQALLVWGSYRQLFTQLSERAQALDLALPAAIVGYFVLPRARYFGNTAPLLIAILFLVLGIAMPHYPGLGFRLVAFPFLFLFVAGVFSDALDTRHRPLILAASWGLLGAYGVWNVMELARVALT